MQKTQIDAIWSVIDNRGLLKDVGEDLYGEIREDLAAAMRPVEASPLPGVCKCTCCKGEEVPE